MTGYLRYQWRVTAYMYGLSTVYPSFGLPSGDADPGGDTAVIMFRRDQRLSRVRVFFRYFMVLPHLLVLYVINIAASGVAHRLVRGAVHRAMADGDARVLRRVSPLVAAVYAFYFMVTDTYPPFSLTYARSTG